MKTTMLLTLIFSFNLLAKVKYIIEPVTWDELQLFQLDSLLSENDLNLDIDCPSTLKILQETHKTSNRISQNILGTNYNWSEFTNSIGLICLVKHIQFDSLDQKNQKNINFNDYELLSVKQAQILLSASRSSGFEEKELFIQLSQIDSHNQNTSSKIYGKYGGAINLFNYIQNNKPYKEIDKTSDYRNSIKNGTEVIEHFTLSEFFENNYSVDQQNQLINRVIKSKMVNTISYDKNKTYKKPVKYDFPLEKSESVIKSATQLLNTLKSQIISPFTYFTYQIYENSKKCQSDFNKLKSPCMNTPPYYDQENSTLTFDFLGEDRELDLMGNIEKTVIKSTKNLANYLGVYGEKNAMIQTTIEDYEIPLTVKKNNLIFNKETVCIKVSLYVGFDSEGYSYNGLRDCNGNIKIDKFIKAYAL